MRGWSSRRWPAMPAPSPSWSIGTRRFACGTRRECSAAVKTPEATQDAFLRAHRALDRFDTTMSFRTWVMSILINRCRSMLLHRRRRTARVQLDGAAVDAARAPDRSGGVELRDAIDHALAQLDPAQREAFLLKHVESMSYEEMAVATGAGISALKMRVQRACDRLQLLLREDVNA